MKKILKIMSCALLVTTITGCGNTPKPSNGNENVVSFEKMDYKVTVDELYTTLKEKYATNYLIEQLDEQILDKEYETDEKADEYVENQVKILKM